MKHYIPLNLRSAGAGKCKPSNTTITITLLAGWMLLFILFTTTGALGEGGGGGEGGYEPPFPYTRYEHALAYTEYPYKTVGMLFSRNPETGERNECTAASINTDNDSVVWTAGHCVHSGGEDGTWFEDFKFAPAYDEGNKPFGEWEWRRAFSLKGWTQDDNPNYDLGAVVFDPQDDGDLLQEKVGSLGWRFNEDVYRHWHVIGYAANIEAGRQNICAGSFGDEFEDPLQEGPPQVGLGCDMKGKASGSPFILEFEEGLGGNDFYINSAVSGPCTQEPPDGEHDVCGAYHGDGGKNLYDAANDA